MLRVAEGLSGMLFRMYPAAGVPGNILKKGYCGDIMKLSFMKESLERDTVRAQRRSISHGEFPPDGCPETEHSGDLFFFPE